MELSQNLKPQRHPDVLERELPDELILYHPGTDDAILLNRVSAAIWDLCDGTQSLDDIANQVADAFGAAHEEVLGDVKETVTQYLQAGLLIPK